MAKITAFRVGHCTHPSCMVLKGSGFKTRCFPSRAYLIETRSGFLLWDTGYADHFHDATAHGVYRLYAKVTPVSLDAHESLQGQLRAFGVTPADIHTLILSHFHGDHVAGMRDFPKAKLLSSGTAWESVRRLSGFAAVREGFLPALLPPDIAQRLSFVDAIDETPLPASLVPFTHGRDVSGSGEVFVVDLPGHVAGHIGAFVLEEQGWTLLASDAAWAHENYREMRGPSELTFLIQHSRAQYYETLGKLQALHRSGNASIRITHEDTNDTVPIAAR